MPQRTRRSSPRRVARRHWYWRFLLVLGVALAIDFFVDDKLLFGAIALAWIGVCYFTLGRLKKSQQLGSD
jgi:hypothetical protein